MNSNVASGQNSTKFECHMPVLLKKKTKKNQHKEFFLIVEFEFHNLSDILLRKCWSFIWTETHRSSQTKTNRTMSVLYPIRMTKRFSHRDAVCIRKFYKQQSVIKCLTIRMKLAALQIWIILTVIYVQCIHNTNSFNDILISIYWIVGFY